MLEVPNLNPLIYLYTITAQLKKMNLLNMKPTFSHTCDVIRIDFTLFMSFIKKKLIKVILKE